MHRRTRFRIICCLCAVLLSGGCSRQLPALYQIVVIPKGTTHAFWKSIHAGALKAAAEYNDGKADGEKVKIIWQGPAREGNRQEQQDIVQKQIAQQVDAIVLAPTDRQTLVQPAEEVVNNKIPLVIIDSGLAKSKVIADSTYYLGYVGTQNEAGGELAAVRMAELLKDKANAKVLVLPYQKGSESTEKREQGFFKKIGEYKNITLVKTTEEAGDTETTAEKAATEVLRLNKDLDGIFTPNESSTVGMIRALDQFEKAGKIKLVGFDGSPTLIESMKSGKVHGLVLQDPFEMGYRSVKRALAKLTEDKAPSAKERELFTTLKIATPKNLEEPAIKKLYSPDLSAVK